MFSLIDLSDQKRRFYGSCSETYDQWGNQRVSMGITYKEVVKAYEKTSPAPVILVIAGGKICELHKKAERDGEVRLVTTKDSIGNKTYKRTACLVLLKAIYDLAGKEKVDKWCFIIL